MMNYHKNANICGISRPYTWVLVVFCCWNNFLIITHNYFVKRNLPFSLARISQIIPIKKESPLCIDYLKESRKVKPLSETNLPNFYFHLKMESLAHSLIHPTNKNCTPGMYKALFYYEEFWKTCLGPLTEYWLRNY